jgi:group I intron endonuclease
MVINKALLKHDISNFSLEILEYCEPADALDREDHYLKLLNPEYNILRKAGSSLGYKHTEESKAKISAKKLGRKFSEEHKANLGANLGRKLSEDTKAKISAYRLGTKLSDKTRELSKISATTAANIGVAVLVKNIKTGETVEYLTMKWAQL